MYLVHLVHPASRILTYLLAALVIPGLPFFMLAPVLAAALILLTAMGRSPWPLVWRTRWLLLVLALGYAWGMPGEPLLPQAGDVSPTLEGVIRGASQALGLLVLLLWLDVLVLSLAAEELLGGLYLLAAPLDALGLDRGHLALRLGLTLKAIESLERGQGNLRRLLTPDLTLDLPEAVHVQIHPLRAWDVLMPALLLAVLVFPWFSA